MKLHLLCATNRVPVSYELTPANVVDVGLVRELLDGAGRLADGVARRLLGDLAYRTTAVRHSRRSWPGPGYCWRSSGPSCGAG
jgi:hypothetical protein